MTLNQMELNFELALNFKLMVFEEQEIQSTVRLKILRSYTL